MSRKNLLYLVLVFLIGIPLLSFFSLRRTSQKTETVSYSESAGVIEPSSVDGGLNKRQILPIEPPVFSGEEDFTSGVDRTIIKTANLSMVVEDVRETVKSASSLVTESGGAVTQSSVNEDISRSGVVNAQMTLRVPVAELESILGKIKSLAEKVIDENIATRDETEQKIDLEAQIKNLKATEQQLLTIMKRAVTVEETLSVQRELSRVRGNIERLDARLENLGGAAEMSTVYLSISTEESELPLINPNEKGLLKEIKIALRQTVSLYRQLFVSGVRGLIFISPILIVSAVGYFIVKKNRVK